MSEQDASIEKAPIEMSVIAQTDADVLIVGGSLSNCLTALWMAEERPDILIGLVDAEPSLLQDRQWVFFDNTVPQHLYRRLRNYVTQRWHGYETRGASGKKQGQLSISRLCGNRVAKSIEASPRIEVLSSAEVTAVATDAIELSGVDLISAPLILDGRPLEPHRSMKFGQRHGCEFRLRCATPHELQHPVLADTSVDQSNGFAFLQTTPMSETDLAITYVCANREEAMDAEAAKSAILRHAVAEGLSVTNARQTMQWSDPLLTGLDRSIFANFVLRKAVPTGQAALLYHPTTLSPVVAAAHTAHNFAQTNELSTDAVMSVLAEQMATAHGQHIFHHELNAQILDSQTPDFGVQLLEHIHSLPESLITRFYSADCRSRDRVRISMVRPGNSLVKAGIAISQLGGSKRAP
ncbi:MAG: lycopene cyclase family protein [Pseudomonadota bacterium]